MSKTRAIRLSEEDEKAVLEFLKENPFFDFSTLTRAALKAFVTDPKLELRPVKIKSTNKKEQRL